jgi:hypothetical protein
MTGIAYTLGTPPPQSVAATEPELITKIWAIGLLVSGTVGLIGELAPLDPRIGVRLVAGALLIGAGALVVVTFAVFSYLGLSRGLFSGGCSAAWLLANIIRAIQIGRDLRGDG